MPRLPPTKRSYTIAERRRLLQAATRLRRDNPTWSHVQAAEAVGVSPSTLDGWIKASHKLMGSTITPQRLSFGGQGRKKGKLFPYQDALWAFVNENGITTHTKNAARRMVDFIQRRYAVWYSDYISLKRPASLRQFCGRFLRWREKKCRALGGTSDTVQTSSVCDRLLEDDNECDVLDILRTQLDGVDDSFRSR